jgi:hypothetical protein
MTQTLTTIRSETDPDTTYTILVSPKGQLLCTCPAWRFTRETTYTFPDGGRCPVKLPCKHLRKIGGLAPFMLIWHERNFAIANGYHHHN